MRQRTGLGLTLFLLFFALVGGLNGQTLSAFGPAELVSTYRLARVDPRFGGLSGIEIFEDGQRFVALSDRGYWTEGRFERNAEGAITAFSIEPMRPLRGAEGKPLPRGSNDSEGLTRTGSGTLYVSFEGPARIRRYDGLDGKGIELPSHRDFAGLARNAAFEALAVDEAGRLFTLPEDTPRKGADFPVYIFEQGQWRQPYRLPRRGDFLPVAADFGPDGRLYLLERAFYGLGGFASRVRAFTLSPGGPRGEELILQTAPKRHDNLEGLAVWRDDRGDIRLSLVSDDNFLFFLRSEIIEYRLPKIDARRPAR